VIGVGTTTSLQLHNFEMNTSDSVLLTDPNP
jgi:hypothetical protein